MSQRRAAISFTGGKDCTMALCIAKATHDIVLLVTFVPKNFGSFKAHSLEIIKLQAKALDIPHILVEIGEEGKTHLECYREKITEVRDQYNLDLLVTGDILNVCGNFMSRATEDIVELSCPIWAIDRPKLLESLFERKFELLITCASIEKLGGDESVAREFVGSRLTQDFMKTHLEPRVDKVDMGGELGEFHTMVLTVPELYNGYRIEYDGRQLVEGEYMYMEFENVRLVREEQKRSSRSSSKSRSTITTNQESTCSSTGLQELSLPPSSPNSLLDHAQSADATSFLGSVWNLVRDAKDLAAKELDKLLEQFPYKAPSKSHLITNEDRILAVKKPGTSTTQASKSLLGHGPRMKRKGHQQPNNKNRAHTKRLLDQGFKALVNDVSSMGVQPMSPSVTSSILSEDNDALWEHSQPSPTPGSVSGSGPETGGSHSAKLLTAASSKHRPYHSSSSHRTKTQDVNGWESSGDGFQRTEESDLSDYAYVHQGPSAANSIASMAEALSISGKRRTRHRQHNHRRHSVNYRGQKRHSSVLNHAAQGRYGPLEERSNLDGPGHVYPISTAIYPQRPSSRAGSASGTETTRRIPSAIADPHTSMTISSREPTPTPFSSAAMSPESHLRESVSPATFEYEKLNELQQELAVIKVQLASLVSARQDDLQRSQFALGTLSPLPPPPPPLSLPWHGASALMTPKKWSPPANPAAQSMSNVLKELSSSGVQLRKTGSPYVR
ncbi:hypothetical protein BG011_008663 [Mortierella polycephala]|uniref:Diphthine--ammonia ligase n=1 Tax=Mortierella polycephala TaxID=41804 RepID=A0A9P6TX86_9FUNG|nr:hypothetical protein BG011_008663 [Mortierella polycephala]